MQVNEAGGLKAFLFHRGFRQKLKYLDQGYAYDKVPPFAHGCQACSPCVCSAAASLPGSGPHWSSDRPEDGT